MADTVQQAVTDLTTAIQNHAQVVSQAVDRLKSNPTDTAAIAAIEQSVSNLNQETSDIQAALNNTQPAPTSAPPATI